MRVQELLMPAYQMLSAAECLFSARFEDFHHVPCAHACVSRLHPTNPSAKASDSTPLFPSLQIRAISLIGNPKADLEARQQGRACVC